MFSWNKKDNLLTLVAKFGRNLKGLVLVGNLCLVADKDISEVSQDFVLCIYHLILFQKIKKGFGV